MTDKSPGELYRERVKRVEDAIQLKVSDRVPILTTTTFFPTNQEGITPEIAMYDYDRLCRAWLKYLATFQPDMTNTPFGFTQGPLMEALDYKVVKWPGHGVSPLHTFQYVEGEYMKAEEYDDFLFDPTDFILRTYLPRVAGKLEELGKLPRFSELSYHRVLVGTSAFALPEVGQALDALIKAGLEARKMTSFADSFVRDAEALGYPVAFSITINTPFDHIGNSFRGTRGIMLDMYRNPDKLLAAIDMVLPLIARTAVLAARKTGNPRIFIPLHKGADGFMSLKQFQTFYWPSLRRLMLTLIEEGLTPCPFFEGQYASRLEIIGDMPRGKALYKFEQTDMQKAKEVLGDRICIRGNVPASMLCTASPHEVKDYCKKLIDTAGKGGGFIMDGATGIPDEARPENVKAMIDFTKEYGVYR